jgi:carboxymethylenebutenolidase
MKQPIIELYDAFTHGQISRRVFMERAGAALGGTAAAYAALAALQNDYASAETVTESDRRITTATVAVPGPLGLSGYLARPRGRRRSPAVLVIHENRGLNPHIKDVTRRFATEGFLALGLDFLSPQGGTTDDDEKNRSLLGAMTAADKLARGRAAIAWLGTRPGGNGKVGAVGFCWGGGVVNALAVAEPDLDAGVAYYGAQAPAADVPRIRAPLLLHYGGIDPRINAGIPAYEAALKAAGKTYEIHVYEGANHAFNNDTSPERYDKAAADLAWSRTVAWLRRYSG